MGSSDRLTGSARRDRLRVLFPKCHLLLLSSRCLYCKTTRVYHCLSWISNTNVTALSEASGRQCDGRGLRAAQVTSPVQWQLGKYSGAFHRQRVNIGLGMGSKRSRIVSRRSVRRLIQRPLGEHSLTKFNIPLLMHVSFFQSASSNFHGFCHAFVLASPSIPPGNAKALVR